MSYCFDVQMRAWRMFKTAGGTQEWYVTELFEQLLDAMHSANHRLDDKINKDRAVSQAAKRLEEQLDHEGDE